jgi:hypothetical protein
VIPEIDIWRVASLMLKRYGSNAELESARRADEIWDDGDMAGAAIWRRIIDAIGQLSNTTLGWCIDLMAQIPRRTR